MKNSGWIGVAHRMTLRMLTFDKRPKRCDKFMIFKRFSEVLALLSPQPRHNAVYDSVGHAFRQLERTAFRDDLYRLAAGIVEDLAGAALRQMQLEFFTNLRRRLILEVVAELG
jgi:hypothetical protein